MTLIQSIYLKEVVNGVTPYHQHQKVCSFTVRVAYTFITTIMIYYRL